jgi:hypothetical protein
MLVRNDSKYLEVETGLGGRILVKLFGVRIFIKIHSGVLELFCGPTQCLTSKIQTQWCCRGCYCSTSKFVITFLLSPSPSENQSVAKRQTDGGLVISFSDEFFQNPSKGPTFEFSPHDGLSVCSGNGASVGRWFRTAKKKKKKQFVWIFLEQWVRTIQETFDFPGILAAALL